MTLSTQRPGLFLVLAATVVLSACAPNVVLRRSATAPTGPFQRCDPREAACQVDDKLESARFNQSNTTYFSLPTCPNGIDSILVENVGTVDVTVVAQCAGAGAMVNGAPVAGPGAAPAYVVPAAPPPAAMPAPAPPPAAMPAPAPPPRP